MPSTHHGAASLYYERDGAGDPVVFIGDIGFGAWQWGWQYAALAGPCETIVLDTRGCGRSEAPAEPCTVGDLAGDVEAVLRDANRRAAHLVGAGLGGMIALELAFATGRARSLTLIGTSADGARYDPSPLFAPPTDSEAMSASLDAAFSAPFRAEHPDALEQISAWRVDEDADRDRWDAQATAIDTFDRSDGLYEVTVPALVVHGTGDACCPIAAGRDLADGLPRGEFEAVDAGHCAHIERSRSVNDRLVGFLSEHDESDR
ncbi:alpha/beta fold hydrolase [Haloferacaceae archaeon DSL9]